MRSALIAVLVTASLASVAPDREIQAKHLNVVLKQSAETVAPGAKVTLIADVTLPPGMHVYAQEIAAPYMPIKLELEQANGVKLGKVVYPASRSLHLAAIDETVPVYEGSFRLQVPASVGTSLQAQTLEIKGSLKYQTCDDKICYRPVSVPVSWAIQVIPPSPPKGKGPNI